MLIVRVDIVHESLIVDRTHPVASLLLQKLTRKLIVSIAGQGLPEVGRCNSRRRQNRDHRLRDAQNRVHFEARFRSSSILNLYHRRVNKCYCKSLPVRKSFIHCFNLKSNHKVYNGGLISTREIG